MLLSGVMRVLQQGALSHPWCTQKRPVSTVQPWLLLLAGVWCSVPSDALPEPLDRNHDPNC